MLAMAKQESGFNPSAKAGTSSASGLYQFVSGTWDTMVKKYGKTYPDLLKGPLNPNASAIAGALYIKDNSKYLEKNGIPVTGTSIYASHFLGPDGARRLFNADLSANAVDVFGKKVADANKSIFYAKDKLTPKSIADVQEFLYNKVGKTSELYAAYLNGGANLTPGAPAAATTMLAANAPSGVTAVPSMAGSEMAAQSSEYQNNQMVAANAPVAASPVVINNSSTAAPQTPRMPMPKAGTRTDDGSFMRALAKDFAHPSAFTSAGLA
jgi:hypothetical protein